ncbi:MAG: preprotein translocase subunit SecG [Candidatus Omnitrophica bacterium]|nr:preprotein translocase subunit SecG [Candidatus Omnitrophota bacterium]
MNLLVVCIHVIVCLVLIIVILLQAGRGQGLTGSSFGGNVQSLFGTKASSFLTKATSICAVLFLFTCIGLNILEIQKSRSLFKTPDSQVPLDVEQIKKALAKVNKSDKLATTAGTKTAIVPKTDAEKAAEATKSEATKLAESLKKEAVTAAAAAKKQ